MSSLMMPVKVRVAGGEPVYAIPEHAKERLAPEEHLRRVLGEWVVEVAHSWVNRFRRLLIRWEKKGQHYLALVQLAAVLII